MSQPNSALLAALVGFCSDLDEVLSRQTKRDDDPCSPQPEKTLPPSSPPPTVAGELCRLKARATYLLALLACETSPGAEDCCDDAYAEYCRVFDACQI